MAPRQPLVVDLLKSIETGDAGPAAAIHPDIDSRPNAQIANGLAGLGAAVPAKAEGKHAHGRFNAEIG